MNRRFAVAALTFALFARFGNAAAEPLFVPFDFSRGAIGLDVTVKGTPLYMMLDTGVDPSVIDSARVATLGLKNDRRAVGEASGYGDGKGAQIFPATIEGLAIDHRPFPAVAALATDMGSLSKRYGRMLDGVLGYSFLAHRIVLIDYARQEVGILDRPADAERSVGVCRKHWKTPLRSLAGDRTPIISRFRIGTASAPISLDTGSNGGVALFPAALDLPGVRAALVEEGEVSHAGARGDAKSRAFTLNASIGFGPFMLPPGEQVTLSKTPGTTDKRVANVGNKLFAALGLKMLLDYRARTMTFYGDCEKR